MDGRPAASYLLADLNLADLIPRLQVEHNQIVLQKITNLVVLSSCISKIWNLFLEHLPQILVYPSNDGNHVPIGGNTERSISIPKSGI